MRKETNLWNSYNHSNLGLVVMKDDKFVNICFMSPVL